VLPSLTHCITTSLVALLAACYCRTRIRQELSGSSQGKHGYVVEVSHTLTHTHTHAPSHTLTGTRPKANILNSCADNRHRGPGHHCGAGGQRLWLRERDGALHRHPAAPVPPGSDGCGCHKCCGGAFLSCRITSCLNVFDS
jgi:hypothetical protein